MVARLSTLFSTLFITAITAQDVKFWCIVGIECNFELEKDEELKHTFLSNKYNCSVGSLELRTTLEGEVEKVKFVPELSKNWPNSVYICRAKKLEVLGVEHKVSGTAVGTIKILRITRYNHIIEQNNELRFTIHDLDAEKLELNDKDPGPSLGISSTPVDLIKELRLHPFVPCGKNIVANVFLNRYIGDIETLEPFYLYLCYPTISKQIFFIERIIVFNGSLIKEIHQKVVQNYILLELRGVSTERNYTVTNLHALEEKERLSNKNLFPIRKRLDYKKEAYKEILEGNISFSVHSNESKDGLSSVCGHSNFLWSKFDIPYYSEGYYADKSILFALPIQLFGSKVLICASLDKNMGQESYTLPVSSFLLNTSDYPYFKNIFTADHMGIVSLKIEFDVHPLSEIRLLHICDYKQDEFMAKFKLDELSTTCKRYSKEDKFGYVYENAILNKDVAYTRSDAYLSVYGDESPSEHFLAHRLAFLPDKGTFLENNVLSLGNIFLPRLVHEPLLPYIVLLCDRWKHPHCLAAHEFDKIAGLIYPNVISPQNVSIRLNEEGLKVKVSSPKDGHHIIKLVEAKYVQYSDFEQICNIKDGLFAEFKLEKVEDKDGETKRFYTYEIRRMKAEGINGVELGKIYYLCMLNRDGKKELNGWEKMGVTLWKSQKNALPSGSVSDWKLLNIVVTQTPLAQQRYTFTDIDSNVTSIFIKTTGYSNDTSISGVYLSSDLLFKCSSLVPKGDIKLGKGSKEKIHPNISFVKYTPEAKNKRDGGPVGEQGFWFEENPALWSLVGDYIRYIGIFKPQEKMYKVCICHKDVCYSGGNLVQSKMTFFDLNQFIPVNDVYNRLVIGRYICMHNRRNVVCFSGTGDLSEMMVNLHVINLSEMEISYVTFDNEIGFLSVLSKHSLYIYNEDLSKSIEVRGLDGTDLIASFPGITFIVLNGSLVAYIEGNRLNALFRDARRNYEKLLFADKSPKSYKYDMDKNNFLTISFKETPRNETEMHIFPSNTSDEKYDIFFIDNELILRYYQFTILPDKKASITSRNNLDLKEYFPFNDQRLMFKVQKISVLDTNYVVIFVCQFDMGVLKVFYLANDRFTFYSGIVIVTNVIDFILTETHIIGLTISFGGRSIDKGTIGDISQSLFQLRYIDLLDISLDYPNVPKEVIYGSSYTFHPSVSNGILVHFYLKNSKDLMGTGLTLNEATGVISGTLTFVGKKTLSIATEGLLGNTSHSISISSNCPLGTEYDGKTCLPCSIGYYKDDITLDRCLKCTESIVDSTTRANGAKGLSECLCPPGSFFSNNACLKCPSGTFSQDHGSYVCLGRCRENEVSTVVGASSLSELKCMCIEGFYSTDGSCKECPPNHYCKGGMEQPVPCGNGMITTSIGKSAKDCICDLGFEWNDGECVPCNTLSYKDFIGNSKCMHCSSDSSSESQLYTMKLGAKNKNDCRFCKPGYYNSENSIYCIPCPPNSFCFGERFKPISCGQHGITTVLNATRASECLCQRGFGHLSFARVNPSIPQKCVKCPLNTWQYLDGDFACIKCPRNSYSVHSFSLFDCLPIPGYYNVFGLGFKSFVEKIESRNVNTMDDAPVIECYSGVVIDKVSSHISLQQSLKSCLELCKANVYCRYAYFMSYGGLPMYREVSTFEKQKPQVYSPCMLFYEALDISTSNENVQDLTDIITTEDKEDEIEGRNVFCKVTRAVHKKLDMVKFVKCPKNYYCKDAQTFGMRLCPEHSTTLSTGASSLDDCLCMPGYEPSLFSPTRRCVPCEKGFYKFERSNEQCKSCPNGMTTMEIGSNHINKCGCPPSFFAFLTAHPKGSGEDRHIYTDTIITGEYLLNLECKECPQNHYCPGFWSSSVNVITHTAPIPCPPGSSIMSLSRNVSSVSSCLCGPGYGIVQHIDRRSQSCERCPPGTFKETFENSSCTERCGTFATSLPGASSNKNCFCLPGWFMLTNERGSSLCSKCMQGAICPGGFSNSASFKQLTNDPNLEVSSYDHASPLPGVGNILIYKQQVHANKRVGPWHPDRDEFYLTRQPSQRMFKLYDKIPDIHPCAYSHRRNTVNAFSCSTGSTGYICGNCEPGYDVEYFQSMCTKCGSGLEEFTKLVLPRFIFVFAVLITCYSTRHANLSGEFSLVAILKILNLFTLSLLPLGLLPITSVSSLRRFYWSFHLLFYYPISWFAHTERVGCWEFTLRKFTQWMNEYGFSRDIFDGSRHLDYKQLWYMQRLVGAVKPLLDLVLLCLLFPLFNLVYQRYIRRKFYEKIKHFLIKSKNADEANESRGRDRRVEKMIKRDTRNLLFQNIVVIIVLHIPSLFINSLSMVWCRPVRYKNEEPVEILLHLPNQECDMENPLFRFGFMVSASLFILVFLFSVFFFFSLLNSDYEANSWKSIFMMGYREGCRWWDIILLLRQFLVVVFVVAQYSVNPRGGSEYVRLLSFMAFNISFLMLHLWYSPYDHRGDYRFHRLESFVFITSIFISLFVHGSCFYDFSRFAIVPIVLALFAYFKIVSNFFLESASIANVQTKFRNPGFIEQVLSILPSYRSSRNVYVYFNYDTNTLVFDRTAFYLRKGLISRLERIFSNLKVNQSESRRFLISTIKDIYATSIWMKKRVMIPDDFIYFIIRMAFWFSYCMHIEMDEKLTEKDRLYLIIFFYLYYKDGRVKRMLSPVISKLPVGASQKNSFRIDNANSLVHINIVESLLVDCLFDKFYDVRPITITELYYALLSLGHLGDSLPRVYALYEAFLRTRRSQRDVKIDEIKNEIDSITACMDEESTMVKIKALSQERQELMDELEKLELLVKHKTNIIAVERSTEKVVQDLELALDKMLVDNLTHEDILEGISKLNADGESHSNSERRKGLLIPVLKLNKSLE
ncbi:hypothetical protein BEWA_029850 [Theileria equi strain WA]|uniref:Uncharacterized protein n=1 Tax=Theileria equi strain WA TaxID=1537102 RepID=L0AZ08_THEEQ|nr:hypothetical protein BEWA_029850 [Theileria equi strain WA]AFZ80134.1 hypothetical protein BEWA_029850 [Theileria equi strain WA]|eukprot:XP_004829800.1 hypothetical protein BEWA_029850 [Theileria equi strain WA]